MSDGAHLGVSAKRALGTILGGQGQPEADERMTVENMREWLLGAPPAGHPTPPQTYDECARRVAGEILRWALTNPERYSHTPAESEIGRPGLYHVLKAEGIPLEDLGISGFQWGWAYNAARRCLELPPVANPAIVTIDTEPAS